MLHRFCVPFLLSKLERKGKKALHVERLEKSVTHLSVPKLFLVKYFGREILAFDLRNLKDGFFFFLKKVLGNRKCI